MATLGKFKVDWFLTAIIAAAVLASVLPAQGVAVDILAWATKVMIFVLFFLYGARLHPDEALKGLRHWRLHLVILAFTFVVFPVLGLLMGLLPEWLVPAALYPGLMYVTLVPSTVQSSINFTSIARGNVAGAIVSASASNLLGVVLTPVLAIALMNTTGNATISFSSIVDIMVQILLPFAIGQLSRHWTAAWVEGHRKLKLFDQTTIVLVVYAAFSAGMREGIWTMVGPRELALLVVVSVALLGFMLWLTWFVAQRLGFNRGDAIAIQMCGTKKSLATGLPMAIVLFAGQPIGLIMLPLMVFHQAQLMACSALASRYARQGEPDAVATT